MSGYKTNLQYILIVCLLSVASSAAFSIENSSDILAPYSTNLVQYDVVVPIFKFKGEDGKITYSSTIPHGVVDAEELSLIISPSFGNVEETRKTYEAIKSTANKLSDARQEREIIRAEKEKIRLERLRLARFNQPKPPIVETRYIHVTRPHSKDHEKRELKPLKKRHSPDRLAIFSTHKTHDPHSSRISHRLQDKD